MSKGRLVAAFHYALAPAVLRKNLVVAAIVGTLLTIVNQADTLASSPLDSLLITKVFFNYLIPLVVSSTGAALNRSDNHN
jgi:hypothetical protein